MFLYKLFKEVQGILYSSALYDDDAVVFKFKKNPGMVAE
jgi:hypothetical protein